MGSGGVPEREVRARESGGSLRQTRLGALVESDPTRMCELLIGLPDINMLGIVEHDGGPLEIHVDSHTERACVG